MWWLQLWPVATHSLTLVLSACSQVPNDSGSSYSPRLLPSPHAGHKNHTVSYKKLLQEYTQKHAATLPLYATKKTGSHCQSMVTVYRPESGERLVFESCETHRDTAEAEQEVAKMACNELGVLSSKS